MDKKSGSYQQFNSRPLISIITVVKNGEKSLEKTIRSVIGQTYENIEYILIDGGSTDNTLSIIKEYEDKIDFWISEPDTGIAHAFNKGIENSTGEYLLFLNSADIFYDNETLKKMVSHLTDEMVLIYTGFCDFLNRKTTLPQSRLSNDDGLRKKASISHQATLAHRMVFERYGKFSQCYKIRSDYDFWLRVLRYENFMWVNDVLVIYDDEGESSDIRNWYRFKTEEIIAEYLNIGDGLSKLNLIYKPFFYCIKYFGVRLKRTHLKRV